MIKRKIKSFLTLLKDKELSKQIKWKYYLDLNHNYKNTVFISGTGRSGTTWLSQILNYDNSFRYIFEPFYPEKVDFCSFFGWRQYLRPTKKYPNYYESAKRIITGRFRNSFIDRYNKKFLCRKRLIKDVKTNLLLGWLNQNFKEMKVLLSIRHPCAIANSWMKLKWEPNLENYLQQEELMIDYLGEFEREIKNTQNRFEQLLFMWCIETYIPMKQIQEKQLEAKIIKYEVLCEKFEETVKEVFNYVNIPFKINVIETQNEPSYTTRPYASIFKGRTNEQTWKKELTKEQIRNAQRITSLFDLDKIYEF